ncbi:MAG: copper-binding protein [Bryobacter sp.]|nr:copper-binding protein [Bryobacter sp.]
MKHFAALAFLLLFGLAGCTQTPRQEAQSNQPIETHALKGEVVRLEGETQVVVVKHEEIPGWMEAMTMGFPVKDKAAFETLKPGQKINAEVKVQGDEFWLEKITPQP